MLDDKDVEMPVWTLADRVATVNQEKSLRVTYCGLGQPLCFSQEERKSTGALCFSLLERALRAECEAMP
ncbi:hypothetical protein C7S18_06130 [Ahniella affigens]|uniref:Uncharacterized protein n=1 Tax=Ahniella affigens TaxID=2021234 RepID=A0A2P1PPN7_9GAMM|nr:hypothetical protein C7S18_06130 [Ahniella affigens]